MARPLRIQFPSASYHVMNRGLDHQDIFSYDRDRIHFLRLLAESVRRFKIKIFAFCLMKNHYHLCLETLDSNLSQALQYINTCYSQYFNRCYNRDGPLFRGRYKAILIDRENYLLQVIRYIHLNPVKAGLVYYPLEYRWSSHWYYLAKNYGTKMWLSCGEILEMFGSAAAYEQFVAAGNNSQLEAFYSRSRLKEVLGRDGFIEKVMSRARISREHSRDQKTPQILSLADVVKTVVAFRRISPDILFGRRQGKPSFDRDLTLFLASHYAGFTFRELQDYFCISRWALSKACSRIRLFLKKNSLFKEELEKMAYPWVTIDGQKSPFLLEKTYPTL